MATREELQASFDSLQAATDNLCARVDLLRASNAELSGVLEESSFCLRMFLDAHGALSNPSELQGYGLSMDEQTRILAALPKAESVLRKAAVL